MTKKSLLWILPFAGFIVGYALANYFFTPASFPTPAIIGLPLAQAAKVLSDHQLNIRIVGEKIDPTVKPETVVQQQPNAKLRIKAHQTVFIVIAQHPISPKTPSMLGLTRQQAEDFLNKQNLTGKWHTFACNAPIDTIIAQEPAPGTELRKSIVMYQAIPHESRVIMPRLIDRPLAEVVEFLQHHQIPFNTVYPEGVTKSETTIIREQRPLAGSLIELRKPPTVQLLVEEPSALQQQIPPDTTAQIMAM